MSAYDNVVVGKLKLKGKALDVKAGGSLKKKKKHKNRTSQLTETDLLTVQAYFVRALHKTCKKTFEGGATCTAQDIQACGSTESLTNSNEDTNESGKHGEEQQSASIDDHLTPAERRYIEQREQLDVHRLAKIANKSHRDRIQDFNQYLANMSEHYDIPKVGPG